MYRSDFSSMMDNIDLAIKLLYDVKDRINDREGRIEYNESNVICPNDDIGFKYIPPAETLLSELRLARKLISESAIEIHKGRHYTGREYEDD